MGNSSASISLRLLGAAVAVLTGYVAVMIALTGEFRSKTGVVELSMWMRCALAGVLGTMALMSAWVVVRGRR